MNDTADFVYAVHAKCGAIYAGAVDEPGMREFAFQIKKDADKNGDTIIIDRPAPGRTGRAITCRCFYDKEAERREEMIDDASEYEREDAPLTQEDRE